MKALKEPQGLCCTYNKFQVNSSKKWAGALHAWDFGDSEPWEEMAKGLNHEDFNVLLVDLPGLGQSESPPESWGTDDRYTPIQNATRVITQLKLGELKVDNQAGHSLQITYAPLPFEDTNSFFEKNKYTSVLS